MHDNGYRLSKPFLITLKPCSPTVKAILIHTLTHMHTQKGNVRYNRTTNRHSMFLENEILCMICYTTKICVLPNYRLRTKYSLSLTHVSSDIILELCGVKLFPGEPGRQTQMLLCKEILKLAENAIIKIL